MLTLDHALRAWIVAHRLQALNGPLWFASVLGRGGLLWIAIAAIVAVRRRRRAAFAVVLLGVLLASTMTDTVVKPAVDRTRPFDEMPGSVIGGRPSDASFPSGHSSNAFAGALTLSRAAPAGAPLWWALAAIIAFSRVYLGVHYPLDVLGGAGLGLACGGFAIWLTRFSEL